MAVVGLRELRQDASALLRRVEAGEVIEITVAGRPTALLSSVPQARWRRWRDLEPLFSGVDDPDWESDRELLDDGLVNPWDREGEGTA